jgi:hypothetical protein
MLHMVQLTDGSFIGLATNGTLYSKATLDAPFVALPNLDPKFVVRSMAVPGAGGAAACRLLDAGVCGVIPGGFWLLQHSPCAQRTACAAALKPPPAAGAPVALPAI